jgi:hypothetical protein
VRQDKEQRIDLIKFYNTIFVQVVKDNALKYSTNTIVSHLKLLNNIILTKFNYCKLYFIIYCYCLLE